MAGRQLKLRGVVDATSARGLFYGPLIGGVDAIGRIDEAFWSRGSPVRAHLGAVRLATGKLATGHAFVGTGVTPGNPPSISVGRFDLVDCLEDLEGREVLLVIEDV